jgi:hypothetical protein
MTCEHCGIGIPFGQCYEVVGCLGYACKKCFDRITGIKQFQPFDPIPGASDKCPDCKGTGKYVGMAKVEDCRTCKGTGKKSGYQGFSLDSVKIGGQPVSNEMLDKMRKAMAYTNFAPPKQGKVFAPLQIGGMDEQFFRDVEEYEKQVALYWLGTTGLMRGTTENRNFVSATELSLRVEESMLQCSRIRSRMFRDVVSGSGSAADRSIE